MSPGQKSPPSVLAAFSIRFAVAAFVCAAVFSVSPKHGIPIVAYFSAMGGRALAALGIAIGLIALIIALIGRKGGWRLSAVGVLANAILLIYFLVYF